MKLERTNPIVEKIFPCEEKRTIFLEKLAVYQGLQLHTIPIEIEDSEKPPMVNTFYKSGSIWYYIMILISLLKYNVVNVISCELIISLSKT